MKNIKKSPTLPLLMGQLVNKTLLLKIGGELQKIRYEIGLSQDQVYQDTGLNISRIESARANITISSLDALVSYYNLTLSKFFERFEV